MLTSQLMPAGPPDQLVAHLFRHEAGRLQAVLTRWLGLGRLAEAEDLVQDTLLEALAAWKLHGVPENPSAWLYKVAQRKTLDVLRREQRYRRLAGELSQAAEDEARDLNAATLFLDDEIADSQLRMLFACCHPALPAEAQVALCLKTLCGLSIAEIAGAFLTSVDTINKRLYRARERIREGLIELEVPSGPQLTARLAGVLQSLYLLFNEGYNSTHPDQLIRRELCEEALRLGRLLTDSPRTSQPETYALLALLCFQASRLDARTTELGGIVLLEDQDRSRWNQGLIAQGLRYLGPAAAGEASEFHLEAAIALEHCRAASFAATDWPAIGRYYDLLLARKPSPVVALHRAVAVAYAEGPAQGLAAALAIAGLERQHLYHAVLGELYCQSGQPEAARRHLEQALVLTSSKAEQELLRRKLDF
jgi:RNA polymerase sigma factor (sigma-70 family)